MLTIAVTCSVNGFITNFTVYLVLQFIMAMGIVNTWISGYPFFIEIHDPKSRNYVVSVLDFPLAVLMLPLFAHLTRDWAILHFVCGGIGFACLASLGSNGGLIPPVPFDFSVG